MNKLSQDCYDTASANGCVAPLIRNTTGPGGGIALAGRYQAGHVFDGCGFFIKTGFTPVQKIR